MNPPEALRARVLASAAATPSLSRREGRAALAVVGVASVAIAGVAVELGGGLAHGAGRPLSITLALTGGWSLASALITWLAMGRGGSTLARRPGVLVSVAVLAPVALFCWMSAFHGSYVEPFERLGYRCFGLTLLIALTPLLAFLRLRRGIEPRLPSALGAAAGAACGAWAALAVDAWCPLTKLAHVFLGHVAPLVFLIGAGAVLGSRLLGVRLPLR